MIIHILPINNLKGHIEASNCDCYPRLEEQSSGDFICVHNSWDGRELREEDE